jgi:hypothetical protein
MPGPLLTLSAVGGSGAAWTDPGAGGSAAACTGTTKFSGGVGGPGTWQDGAIEIVIGGGGGGSSAGTAANGTTGAAGNIQHGEGGVGIGGAGGTAPSGGGDGGHGSSMHETGGSINEAVDGVAGGGGGGAAISSYPGSNNGGAGGSGKAQIFETGGGTVTLVAGINIYKVPTGITQINFRAWGGGGGGGNPQTSEGVRAYAGAGGGGGAFSGTPLAVNPGEKYEVTVTLGAGGVYPQVAGGTTTISVIKLPVIRKNPATDFMAVGHV